MPAKDCLYEIEGNPALLSKVKHYLVDGDEAELPSFLKKVVEQTKIEKRSLQLSAVKLKDAITYISKYAERSQDPKAWKHAIENIVAGTYQVGRKHAGTISIEARAKAVLREYHAGLSDMMHNYRPRKWGFDRSVEAQHELVRALYGESLDVDAKAYAKMLNKATDRLMERFNKAGGFIRKLETYRLPQFSDPIAVGKVKFKEWYNFVKDKLDNPAMVKQVRSELGLGEEAVLSEAQVVKAMESVYNGIRTKGLSNLRPGRIKTVLRSPLERRHQEHRFLHFKDADSWIAYNDRFGTGTPYSAIMGHADKLSREIAAMETLGPNPERNLQYLIDLAKRETGKENVGNLAQNMYRVIMGEMEGTSNPKVQSAMRSIRNVMAGTKLGAAGLSALADTFFVGSASKFNDISMVKVYTRFMKLLNPAHAADRILAGKLHVTMDYALDSLNQFNRVNAVTGHNWSAKFADSAMRLNGLTHWTHAAEAAFGLEFMSRLGEMVGKSYDDIPIRLRRALGRYGISADDWGQLSHSNLMTHDRLTYLNPGSIKSDDLTSKIVGMVAEETSYAVPAPNARIRAYMTQGHASGTVAGELFTSLGQFKSFPVTIMINQIGRRLSQDAISSRIASLGSMVVGTTIIGAFAYNLKQVAKGRTPQDWSSKEFWMNGFIQGGSGGLIGDFLFMDPSKQGSVLEFAAGPLAGEAGQVVEDFLLRPIHELGDSDKDFMQGLAKRSVKTAERYIPAPLNLPFIRLAVQRGVFDQLNKAADPRWRSKQRRLQRTLRKEAGQEYWWKP